MLKAPYHHADSPLNWKPWRSDLPDEARASIIAKACSKQNLAAAGSGVDSLNVGVTRSGPDQR